HLREQRFKRPRPHRRCWTSRPDLGEWWPSPELPAQCSYVVCGGGGTRAGVRGNASTFLSTVFRSCSQINLGQCRTDRCPDCKQSCPCRRISSCRQPRREFAFGMSFARFAPLEIRLDPTQARIECDRTRF